MIMPTLKTVKIDPNDLKELSDSEIREHYRKNKCIFNREYITSICKQCGVYNVSVSGSTMACKIKDKCPNCN